MRRRTASVVLTAALVGGVCLPLGLGGQAQADSPGCGWESEPSFRGDVPTASEVIGFDLGDRDVTVAESDAYLQAVADASPRVADGVLATSHQGRDLRYAVVGKAGNVTGAGLARVRAAAEALRDPATPPSEAAKLADKAPAILWVAGNVHGNEESGTDASLRVLYELADRDDCAARTVLDNAVVVVLPTQNPDGREADARRNAYGFDMNRDWFARTQPETDGKVDLLRQYPGVLFIDSHEMGGTSYFFPPNADPIYHEITDESVSWINDTYGAAVADKFTARGIDYFNRDVYDLFYMGYGDSVPSTGFISAGMTFEKGSEDTTAVRTFEQYVAVWTSLGAAASDKSQILADWHDAWVEAYEQGQHGELEPNEIVNPGNEVDTEVPSDPVRHYFLPADDPAKEREVTELVRRLQRMDVDVYRLTAPLDVPDYTAYGRDAEATTLPVGTYWVPMAQGQKHWVQAMLNEDTYTPFPYFYDVTAWSQPLLFNVAGGRSGLALDPQAAPAPALDAPEAPSVPGDAPRVGLWQMSTSSSGIESSGWLRWLLEKDWGVEYREVTAADIAAGLDDVDVLLVPNGSGADAQDALGPAGQEALRSWVHDGGQYVGFRGGTALASLLGLTTATFADPTSDVPGSLIRVRVDDGSPLAEGVGETAYSFYEYDMLMTPSDPATAPVTYPPADSDDWFVSGFADGEEELAGTAAVVDEPSGDGRVVLFAGDPNFRAFTDGTQRLLWNAVFGAEPAALAPVP
ncbi:MAG: M14 family zinc carboxypeptidase [Actinomycetes bacterium]